MSTSMKKAKAHKPPVKAVSKVALKARVATSRPKAGGKVMPPVSKSKAKVPPPLKVTAKPVAKKVSPAAKKPAKAASSKLKLVTPAPLTKVAAHASPKVLAPVPVQDKVRIFQIYFQPEQRQQLDPAFVPYNNQGDNSPLREFSVFRRLLSSELVKGADYWGALSWKFLQKMEMTGEQLKKSIDGNPGYDVYYCNPYPDLEGLYHNLWLQGETAHPNFLILCRDFLQAAGLDEKMLFQMLPSRNFAASNYFVATPAFWRDYVSFIADVIERAEKGMSSTAKAMIYSSAADQKGMHANANYMPFIVERLFTVFLTKNKERYRSYRVPSDQKEEKLNVHLKLLRQMKDVAVSSKSPWMAACWVNYRNLYMQQFHGKDWCDRYLREITPRAIVFPDA